jgi:EH signature protein
MIQIREGLDRLTADLTELRESMMWRPVDPAPYLRQLDKAVEALEAKSDKVSPPKPPLNAEEVWARWRTLAFDLSKLDAREIRTLCVSPKTAMKARLISAISSNSDPLKRWINLNGFVQAYFGQWRTMESPEVAEKLIVTMLSAGRIARRSKILDLWRQSPFLFSPEASRRVGKIILKDHKSVKQSCAEYCIEPSSPLACAAHEYAAAVAAEELVQRDSRMGQELALKELQWISDHLLTPALGPDAYREAMSKLIVSRMAEGMPSFQSALVSLVHDDDRLGDPRLAYCAPNWRKVPEARERFLAWLAKETLQFFFDTLVPRNDTNRRRAEFWLEYAKKQGKIKDFQVAVSEEDRPKIRASRAKTIPSYSSITGGKTSAFLMIYEGYGTEFVVIEFSETGNAAYIYPRQVFEARGITIRSNSFHLTDDLKRVVVAEDRIWHRINTIERWETKARRQLAELGIRP